MKSVFRLIKKWLQILFLGKTKYARSLGVKIGQNCRVIIHDFGSEPFLIEIGDRVTITHGCVILTHDGSTCLMVDEKGRRQSYGRVIIGNDVFIGINSIIMPGVTIGNRCVVGAGSVVTKSLPDGFVVAGNPARYVMSFDDYLKRGLEYYPADGDFTHYDFRDKVLKMVPGKPKESLDANKVK